MSTSSPIYLDYNATTPLDPAVLEAMLPYLREHFGNPSSAHVYGRRAHEAVERARTQVAALIGAEADEIVFTGGGTEASNQAIKGVVFAQLAGFFGRVFQRFQKPLVVISAIEHPATVQPCEFLKKLGGRVIVAPVDRHGVVDLESLKQAAKERPQLFSIMHANNEVGTLEPIQAVAEIAHDCGALMHTDAAQSLGKIAVDVRELGVDLLTVAGHKLYAPKGVGALYVRRGVKLEPFIHGAGHEAGRRAGTENVPYIIGLGTACEIARRSLPEATDKLRRLRERLWQRLQEALGDRVVLNGHATSRLPNTLNVNFLGHIGAELLEKAPDVAASTGSACHEGKVALSPVLCAMKVPPEIGKGAVRLSVGRFTTEEEVDRAAAALITAAR
jgi:cysteine desulfurase